jgi:hypothetical protein
MICEELATLERRYRAVRSERSLRWFKGTLLPEMEEQLNARELELQIKLFVHKHEGHDLQGCKGRLF